MKVILPSGMTRLTVVLLGLLIAVVVRIFDVFSRWGVGAQRPCSYRTKHSSRRP